ncbi:MAG: type II toxin-antitoxin system RelE/ParE family toxin [Candidatus Njordarchaeota archaeon]
MKLRGLKNYFRIRIGALRVMYEVLWEKKGIIIHFVGHRKKAYK